MPIFALTDEIAFPDPRLADETGLLAVGGALEPERLLLAYAHGIFPWPVEGYPLLWHSPDPRMVLYPGNLHVGRSLKKVMRNGGFEVAFDTRFEDVIRACSEVPRPDQDGTWIDEEMIEAYVALHRLGFAHSIESYLDGELVGGLYGISLGSAFFGESMFARASNASKVAFVQAVETFKAWGFSLIDCQIHTEHLEKFGAVEIPREQFLAELAEAVEAPTRRGSWSGVSGTDEPAG